jgi:hypothetical protein
MNDTLPTLDRRRARALFGDDTGAATAEYAITTIVRRLRVTWGREARHRTGTRVAVSTT